MTVVIIREDNHGVIGVAVDYKNAVKYLVRTAWLDGRMGLYDGEKDTEIFVECDLGENWLDVILNWPLSEFNWYFDGYFYLEEIEVSEYND